MDLSNLKIRLASLEDEQVIYTMICELEHAVLDREAFEFVYKQNLKNDMVGCFIAHFKNKAIGMGSCHVQLLLHHASSVAEIQEMIVFEDYRSMNVGKMLMSHLIEFAKSKGAAQLEVTSRAYRESAHRFYEREGFEKSHVKLVRYF